MSPPNPIHPPPLPTLILALLVMLPTSTTEQLPPDDIKSTNNHDTTHYRHGHITNITTDTTPTYHHPHNPNRQIQTPHLPKRQEVTHDSFDEIIITTHQQNHYTRTPIPSRKETDDNQDQTKTTKLPEVRKIIHRKKHRRVPNQTPTTASVIKSTIDPADDEQNDNHIFELKSTTKNEGNIPQSQIETTTTFTEETTSRNISIFIPAEHHTATSPPRRQDATNASSDSFIHKNFLEITENVSVAITAQEVNDLQKELNKYEDFANITVKNSSRLKPFLEVTKDVTVGRTGPNTTSRVQKEQVDAEDKTISDIKPAGQHIATSPPKEIYTNITVKDSSRLKSFLEVTQDVTVDRTRPKTTSRVQKEQVNANNKTISGIKPVDIQIVSGRYEDFTNLTNKNSSRLNTFLEVTESLSSRSRSSGHKSHIETTENSSRNRLTPITTNKNKKYLEIPGKNSVSGTYQKFDYLKSERKTLVEATEVQIKILPNGSQKETEVSQPLPLSDYHRIHLKPLPEVTGNISAKDIEGSLIGMEENVLKTSNTSVKHESNDNPEVSTPTKLPRKNSSKLEYAIETQENDSTSKSISKTMSSKYKPKSGFRNEVHVPVKAYRKAAGIFGHGIVEESKEKSSINEKLLVSLKKHRKDGTNLKMKPKNWGIGDESIVERGVFIKNLKEGVDTRNGGTHGSNKVIYGNTIFVRNDSISVDKSVSSTSTSTFNKANTNIVSGVVEFTTVSTVDFHKSSVFGVVKKKPEARRLETKTVCSETKPRQTPTYGVIKQGVEGKKDGLVEVDGFASGFLTRGKKNKTIISYGKVLITSQKKNCTTLLEIPKKIHKTGCNCVLFQNVYYKKFNSKSIKTKSLFHVLDLHIHHKIEEETMNDHVERRKSYVVPLATFDIQNDHPFPPPENHVLPLVNMKLKRSKLNNSTAVNKTIRNSYKRKIDSSSRLIENLPKAPVVRLPGGGGNAKRTVVSLLGLFELSTRDGDRPEGRSELAAAQLAVKHINMKKLLPGYTLELLTNDTQCDPGVGVDRFFHALYTQKSTRMVMLLGSACSEVTESLAKVVPYWNIVQVSFGSTSPALSDRQEFPLFYRTVAPDSSHNPARIAFVRRFGWDTVAAFSQNGDAYSLALNELVTELERANITCSTTITFAETDLKEQLRVLRDEDIRIIIGSFSHEVAPKIFCEAYQLGMFGADYAWILQGNGANTWWMNSTECPRHQLIAAVEGLILVSSHNSIVGKQPSLSGLTNEMFANELETQEVQVSKYAPQTYDAVWAIALALSGAENIWSSANNTTVGHFDYTRRDMAAEFLQQLGRLNFLGISGPVSFSGADRVGTSAFHQVQDEIVRTVALYYPSSSLLDFECPGCQPLRWQGGQVPIAKRVFKVRVVTISPAAFLVMSSLAVVGIMLALAFLSFNLHFRRLKSIKLSSPRLNNMTIVGCILVYAAVILLGLDHATLRVAEHFATVCTARVYLLSAGFSLAFGSMFTKTYRVHRIFIRSRSGVVKDKLLQDTQLISLICVLLLIDVFIVTLWVIIDPMQRTLRNLTLEISSTDRSVVYQPQVEVCRSQNTNGWLGALYVYKGLLLLVGVYMAWETRHVKIPALNDSQYIGMSVYSVVITSGIVVVLANLMSEKATLSFVTITTFILISTTTTLCLLFLPKVHAIMKKSDNCDAVIQSMGLKLECNTRRFVTDDRRELQYRVEIQNKVYRREVAALDLEIGRLEKQLLDMNSVSASSSTSSMTRKHIPESIEEAIRRESHPRTPSIGGGLPLLLLSVLPPVIPRASWPSAVQELPMRRNVTFSSEPKLDDQHIKNRREPMIDLYNLCLRPERFNEKLGVLGRLKNLFGSRPSVRKDRASSYAGSGSVGIASALRVHMGYIAGLVPGTNTKDTTSSCNTSTTGINKLEGLYSRRQSYARQGGSGPIISITSDMDDEEQDEEQRKFFFRREESVEGSKVNFALPLKRKSITHQHSQPVLSFRERARGSPRFPHKIMPTGSLTALEDRRKSSCVSAHSQNSTRRSSHQPPSLKNSRRKMLEPMGPKWKSMEDASTTVIPGSRRGSGVLAISCLPSGAQPAKARASSYSPNCDVWSTAEFGIPLSELVRNGQ